MFVICLYLSSEQLNDSSIYNFVLILTQKQNTKNIKIIASSIMITLHHFLVLKIGERFLKLIHFIIIY